MQHIRLFLVIVFLAGAAEVRAESGWYLKPYGGFSSLSDTTGEARLGVAQPVEVNLSNGFLAGLGIGYHYSENWAVEMAWEYRSNDSETLFADGTFFDDGNYASSIIYLNGYYLFEPRMRWQPYLGAGVGWVQEIDIDLEGMGPEQSFSGDGELALQLMGGVHYKFSERWQINAELRYSRISDIDLEAESGGIGAIKDLDYDPWSVAVGMTYSF